ncbi:hypothetical protein CMI39_01540 [Candidatus Pacearchaeota archaeon]|jgi:glycosyltransferase involved in cell wall biosynthesis|nr:hypothetical protein [Candidatus Pacearchaeota archaeon]|tara:strand:- start:14599 stop:15357 length:759 start_codon:yes stop_codon:yes gene_type:complete
MEKVSIIIPAHNEEKRIGRTLKEYISYFKRKKLNFQIIVVLNACSDNTLKIVKKYKELEILNFKQGGKGFAIIEGFKKALKKKSNLIGFVDADMATPPVAFYDLIKNIENNDGVIANRWDKKSYVKTPQTILRRIIGRGFNLIVKILFLLPHQDTQCGAKLFRRELLEKIIPKLGSSEWSFDVDLLFYARREKAKIRSIPTIWNDQKGSKINLKKNILTMFLSIVRLRLVHSHLNFIVRFYRKLPNWMRVHN